MGAPDGVEREAKISAPAGFCMPSLDGVIPGIVMEARPPVELSATYYDTADLRLTRIGASLRHRVDISDASGESGWTVKLPSKKGGAARSAGALLARREVDIPGGPGVIPDDARRLVIAQTRLAPLVPVGKLVTRRRRWLLRLDADRSGGAGVEAPVLAELDDDEVIVYQADEESGRFREIEVELAPGEALAPGLIGAVISRLVGAGAGAADPVPKIVRALGERATLRPEPAAVELGRKPTTGDVVRSAITASVLRLIDHDPGVRLGEDSEDVHQARVATRRLRSDLSTFEPILRPDWVAAVRGELSWLGDGLGAVRDADVLFERLAASAEILAPEDRLAAAPLLRQLAAEREGHRTALAVLYGSDRYLTLLETLVAAAAVPPWAMVGRVEPEPQAQPNAEVLVEVAILIDPIVGSPARRTVPALVRRPADVLHKTVKRLGPAPDDEALHEVRRKAKRCRYASEAAIPAVGADARRLANAVAGVQEILGSLQDAVVAEEWLRLAAASHAPPAAFAAGLLVAAEHRAMAEARAGWRAAWKVASARSLWRWVR